MDWKREPESNEAPLTLVFIYSGEFAERVIRNLINDPSFCKSCGLFCNSCKYGVYSHVRNIRAAVELRKSSELPTFIDDPEKYMPRNFPKADLYLASGLHKDLLLELPRCIEKVGTKGLIVPIEDSAEVPPGLVKQVDEKCKEAGLESAFPKPFCSLEPSEDKPTISRFVNEFEVGRPLLKISTVNRDRRKIIEFASVERSAPCGSTWYIAQKVVGLEAKREILYDGLAKAHHSYPCTATMEVDPEIEEPILHAAGYIIREEIEKALERVGTSL